MKATTISVVTPSYNQGRFIEETIKSVISQAGDFHLEYLVMDGGSRDESVDIIKKYERLLKDGSWPIRCLGINYRWVSEKDAGQADAVNKGFRASKGEILGWVNSDDTYIQGAVQKALQYFASHPDTSMVYGEAYYIDKSGAVIERYNSSSFDIRTIPERCYVCQPAAFLRKSVLDDTGYLDDKLDFCMDYEFWIRIASKGKRIDFMQEYLANSRIYQETKTVSKKAEANAEALRMLKKYYGCVPDSWIYEYTHTHLEKWIGKSDSKAFFRIIWMLFFILKSVQENKKVPFSEIRKNFFKTVKVKGL